MKKILTLILFFLFTITMLGCGKKVSKSPLGCWEAYDGDVTMEFFDDGTAIGTSKFYSEGTYIGEQNYSYTWSFEKSKNVVYLSSAGEKYPFEFTEEDGKDVLKSENLIYYRVATENESESESQSDGKVAVNSLNIGDEIELGHYEQNNNTNDGNEPIKWTILEHTRDGHVILLSRYGLDAQPFNTEDVEVTWENCTLRKWLNDDFYNAAFDEKEKEIIKEVQVFDMGNRKQDITGGNDTFDKIWLLSAGEANTYISFTDMNDGWVETTPYVQEKGFKELNSYWLRTPHKGNSATITWDSSDFFKYSNNVSNESVVRPVMVVSSKAFVASCNSNIFLDPLADRVEYGTTEYEPKIGMSATEVLNSTWGEPDKKNIDEYEWGIEEQWVYKKRGYIYFEDGIVTAIQHR